MSPDIFGLTIESNNGVIVDNIPQRGSAGLEFTMVDIDNLKEIYRKLSPDLVILHYGLNIVKNVKIDYEYYKRGLARQITALKEAAPASPILVIGVTDMASTSGDTITSYTNIPAIIKAQKEAAGEAGAAFWDAYGAMGGSRSIVEWAERKPALADDDLVHFTYPGADTLAAMLYKALFRKGPVQADLVKPEAAPISIEAAEVAAEQPAIPVITKIFAYDPDKPFIFSAPVFWLFLLIVLAGYSLVYRKLFLRNFYLLSCKPFLLLQNRGLIPVPPGAVTIIHFTCGYLIYRSGRKFINRFFILLSLIL